ncbi:MAG: SPOR domain-containing protein [Bacteroidetes bacterium]|nr:SPOR domain-containing protein [Bacteroidota bacterium]
MRYIKFTIVKLIIRTLGLLYCVYLIPVNDCAGAQKFVVQVAATKTPLNIQSFVKKYNINESIKELKSDDWNRYIIGSFDSYKLASNYAIELVKINRLSGVFIRNIEKDSSGIFAQAKKKEVLTHFKKEEQVVLAPNSAPIKPELSENKQTDSLKIKKDKLEARNMGNYFLHLLLTDLEIKTFKNDLVEYGENNVSESYFRFYLSSVDFVFKYPFAIVLFGFIFFFIFNIVTVLFVLNFTIKEKNRLDRYIKVYSKMYEGTLLAYLFGEIDWDRALIQLKHIKRKENKKILISILFNFHENLKGEVDKFIPEIFVKLGLHNDSLKASESYYYHKKTQAIRELTYLYPEGAVKIIPELINYSNDRVRAEVQTSYIRLNQNHPFKFFRKLTKPFARWTQLSAFYLIRLHQLPVPSFAEFLTSKQYTVREFCLNMIIYFQQLENISAIFQLLESSREQTRFLSYKAINDLRLFDGKLRLKKRYRDETEKNKLEIVKAFRNIGNEEDLDFLEIIIKSESISLKIEACRSLYYMNSQGKERMISLTKEYDSKLELFISHVTDPRN